MFPIMPFAPELVLPGGVTVTRRAAGAFVDGIDVAGATSTFVADPVIVYPATARELERTLEGQRTREDITIISRVALLVAQDPAGSPGDLVTYNGATYLVVAATMWPGSFYESRASRQYA